MQQHMHMTADGLLLLLCALCQTISHLSVKNVGYDVPSIFRHGLHSSVAMPVRNCEQRKLSWGRHSSVSCLGAGRHAQSGSWCATAGMHELAESGGAAHAAYKGGLDALQANRLQAWTHTLRALPPALSSQDLHPHEWSNQAAAAEQLFRCGSTHLSLA